MLQASEVGNAGLKASEEETSITEGDRKQGSSNMGQSPLESERWKQEEGALLLSWKC